MLTSILILAIGIIIAGLLFLCLYFAKPISKRNAELQEEKLKLEDQNALLKERLIHFLDVTRIEAMDSYRKGLNDGLTINKGKEMNGVISRPVRTMEDVEEETEEKKKAKAEQKAFVDSINAMMNFNGDIPKEVDED